jgi:hypothetical protein
MSRQFLVQDVANKYMQDKTTGMLKGMDGQPMYFVEGKTVSREVFDAESGLAHLSAIGFDESPAQVSAPAPGAASAPIQAKPPAHEPPWFVTLCAALVASPAPVIMIGQCRTGKSRLAAALAAGIQKEGGAITVSEHQTARDVGLKGAHVIVFRQSTFDDAALMADAFAGRQVRPDQLLKLPRFHAIIRLAGESHVELVDTSTLYADPA